MRGVRASKWLRSSNAGVFDDLFEALSIEADRVHAEDARNSVSNRTSTFTPACSTTCLATFPIVASPFRIESVGPALLAGSIENYLVFADSPRAQRDRLRAAREIEPFDV